MKVDKTYSSPSEGPYSSYYAQQFKTKFGKCFVTKQEIQNVNRYFIPKEGTTIFKSLILFLHALFSNSKKYF